MLEQRDASGLHPFHDVDIAVFVEAGVVGVDEFAGLPELFIASDFELLHLRNPLGIVA